MSAVFFMLKSPFLTQLLIFQFYTSYCCSCLSFYLSLAFVSQLVILSIMIAALAFKLLIARPQVKCIAFSEYNSLLTNRCTLLESNQFVILFGVVCCRLQSAYFLPISTQNDVLATEFQSVQSKAGYPNIEIPVSSILPLTH